MKLVQDVCEYGRGVLVSLYKIFIVPCVYIYNVIRILFHMYCCIQCTVHVHTSFVTPRTTSSVIIIRLGYLVELFMFQVTVHALQVFVRVCMHGVCVCVRVCAHA